MALSREEIAARYSKALFEYSYDANVLDEVHDELNVLLQVAKANSEIIQLLSDPILNKDEKRAFLDAFTTGASDETKEFLKFLVEYQRFSDFIDIIEAFDVRYNKAKNIADGIATTAIALQKEELDKIANAYAKKYGLATLKIKNKVDPSILGGVVLQVGDIRIDGSIRTKLQEIREQLLENKRGETIEH